MSNKIAMVTALCNRVHASGAFQINSLFMLTISFNLLERLYSRCWIVAVGFSVYLTTRALVVRLSEEVWGAVSVSVSMVLTPQ